MASAAGSALFVALSAAIAVAVPDLGSVLHLIGGTAAAFIIFFLPGLLLINAAIVKHTEEISRSAAGSFADLQALVEGRIRGGDGEGGNGNGREESLLLPSSAASSSAAAAGKRRAAAARRRRARRAAAAAAAAAAEAAANANDDTATERTTATGGGDGGFELGGEGVGIKRVGLIYSPRKSWWAGTALVALAVGIWAVTILTAVVPFRE